jgi:hypothetical protein
LFSIGRDFRDSDKDRDPRLAFLSIGGLVGRASIFAFDR